MTVPYLCSIIEIIYKNLISYLPIKATTFKLMAFNFRIARVITSFKSNALIAVYKKITQRLFP